MVIDVNLTGHRPACYGPVCYSTLFLQCFSSIVNFSDILYKLNALISRMLRRQNYVLLLQQTAFVLHF